jgi:ribosomal protein S18 acetylase RimI-like enzyme
MSTLEVVANGAVTNDELNGLFNAAWIGHEPRDFGPVLNRSLVYLTAREHGELLGFVNVAWDGGHHAFLLDPTVHPRFQRRGIGTQLVRGAAQAAQARGAEWLHVDFERDLEGFYVRAGFRPTAAGVWNLARAAAV